MWWWCAAIFGTLLSRLFKVGRAGYSRLTLPSSLFRSLNVSNVYNTTTESLLAWALTHFPLSQPEKAPCGWVPTRKARAGATLGNAPLAFGH
jgi:hypothetical protein